MKSLILRAESTPNAQYLALWSTPVLAACVAMSRCVPKFSLRLPASCSPSSCQAARPIRPSLLLLTSSLFVVHLCSKCQPAISIECIISSSFRNPLAFSSVWVSNPFDLRAPNSLQAHLACNLQYALVTTDFQLDLDVDVESSRCRLARLFFDLLSLISNDVSEVHLDSGNWLDCFTVSHSAIESRHVTLTIFLEPRRWIIIVASIQVLIDDDSLVVILHLLNPGTAHDNLLGGRLDLLPLTQSQQTQLTDFIPLLTLITCHRIWFRARSPYNGLFQ